MTDTPLHHRHSIRLKGYDYSLNGAYFITICTRDKKNLFGRVTGDEMNLNKTGEVVANCWQSIPTHFPEVELGQYVVMPNHLHGVLFINAVEATDNHRANNDLPLQMQHGTSMTIGSIIRGFKIGVTKRLGYSPWQRNYYEHIIRNQQSFEQITHYIINNPINWGTDCYFGANNDLPLQTQH